MNIKVGITGHRGRVGTYLLKSYPNQFVALECDVTYLDDVKQAINHVRPDLVLHLASKSDIDFCENEKNKEAVIASNVRGAFNVGIATEDFGIGMTLMSSAYVFDGKKWFGKYKETDRPNPANFYGYTKQGAESFSTMFDNFKIIRTSYLFDENRLGHAIVRYHEGHTQDYPTFLKRSFLYIPHFVEQLRNYFAMWSKMPRVLHLAGCESTSWYQFVHDVFYYKGLDVSTVFPRQQEDDGYAPRGKNLGLDTSLSEKLGFAQFSYEEGIKSMLK